MVSPEQIQNALQSLNKATFKGYRNLTMIMLFWDAMIRKEELIPLRMDHVPTNNLLHGSPLFSPANGSLVVTVYRGSAFPSQVVHRATDSVARYIRPATYSPWINLACRDPQSQSQFQSAPFYRPTKPTALRPRCRLYMLDCNPVLSIVDFSTDNH